MAPPGLCVQSTAIKSSLAQQLHRAAQALRLDALQLRAHLQRLAVAQPAPAESTAVRPCPPAPANSNSHRTEPEAYRGSTAGGWSTHPVSTSRTDTY